MTVQQFFNKWSGKGIDFDHAYGNQCVDLYDQYCQDVVNAPVILVVGAADIWDNYPVDFFTRVLNTPDGVPQLGDVVIFNKKVGGGFGHVSIFQKGDINSFTSFDQNWTHPYCEYISHDYNNVIGWLHPVPLVPPVDQQAIIDKLRKERDDNWNLHLENEKTIASLNDQLSQQKEVIKQKELQLSTQTTALLEKDKTIKVLQAQANQVPVLAEELLQAKNDRTICLQAQESQNKKIGQLQAIINAGKPKTFLDRLKFLFGV